MSRWPPTASSKAEDHYFRPVGVLEPQREAAQPGVARPGESLHRIVAIRHLHVTHVLMVFAVLGRLGSNGRGAQDHDVPSGIERDRLSRRAAQKGARQEECYRQAAVHRVAPGGGTRPAYRSRVKPMSRTSRATSAAASQSYSAACCSYLRKSCRSSRRGRTSRPDTPWCSRT